MGVNVDVSAGEVGEIHAKEKEEGKDLVTSSNVRDCASINVETK